MVYLLDVNVLVALFDPGHVHHEAAHAWLEASRASGWATCPMTENGFVRVISNPVYPGRRTTVRDAADRLARFTLSGHHTFWTDDVSILDSERLLTDRLGGHREVADAYLLALAVGRGGALVTFDRGVRREAVPGARPEQVVVLPAEG
jgi:toxin-antitoxin system PIN domain toxin